MGEYKVVHSPEIEELELPEVHYHNDIDQPAISLSDLPAGTDHSTLTNVTIDQHHARDHTTRHLAGGGDAFTGANILTYQEVDTTTWAKNIIPDVDNSRDLGSSSKDWANIYGNNIRGKSITNRMGTSTTYNTLTTVANVNTTAVGNVGGGTDDLITYALPANSLSANGKAVKILAWGTTANNANAKTLTLNFGSQIILTQVLTVSIAGTWRIDAVVVRNGASTQDIFAELLQLATIVHNQTITAGTQTDTAAITIKCTGAATTDNDIVQEGLLVEFIN